MTYIYICQIHYIRGDKKTHSMRVTATYHYILGWFFVGVSFTIFAFLCSTDLLCNSKTKRYDDHGHQQSLPHFWPSNEILSIRNGGYLSVDRTSFITYIQQQILGPSTKPYNLTHPHQVDYSQVGQSRFVDDMLGHKQGGFYVECGAATGEHLSNSLFFEKSRNWSGILVEANPNMYSTLLSKQRKTYSINACLSLTSVPRVINFKPVGLLGGIDGAMDDTHLRGIKDTHAYTHDVAVQCFPLHSIMEALGRSHITYLSLDVEGPELDILRTIPWDRLRIDVMGVEYTMWDGHNVNTTGSKRKLSRIREYIKATGLYEEAAILPAKPNRDILESYGLDVVFKRRDLVT